MGQYGDSFVRFAGEFTKKYFIKRGMLEELQKISRNDILKIKGLGSFTVQDNLRHSTSYGIYYQEIILRKFL